MLTVSEFNAEYKESLSHYKSLLRDHTGIHSIYLYKLLLIEIRESAQSFVKDVVINNDKEEEYIQSFSTATSALLDQRPLLIKLMYFKTRTGILSKEDDKSWWDEFWDRAIDFVEMSLSEDKLGTAIEQGYTNHLEEENERLREEIEEYEKGGGVER